MCRLARLQGLNKTLYLFAAMFSLLSLLTQTASAQLTSANFALSPPLITDSAPPNVMLVLSNDHELYKKAYSDFTDIDADGLVDGSYKDGITYSGYFDSDFCYRYDSGDSRFEPATDISSQLASSGHSCAAVTGNWSGNFLNWASMSRMDIIRHVLFGGRRIVDTATTGGGDGITVLERVYIPEDTHSFVKVFVGDTEKYTPWNEPALSLCSTTYGSNTSDPVIRIAEGAWPLWSSSEVVQCHYRSENGSDGSAAKPSTSDRPAPYEFDVQVQVCVNGVDASSKRCKAYTDGGTGYLTYKPVGLLQQYGDNSTINFGLISGSYDEKIKGGVLRKNIVPFTGNSTASLNEVDLDNGRFLNQGSTDAGIINTISRFEITDWSYGSNRYDDCSTHSIAKSTFKSSGASNRQCRNWGNPLSEIYLEALRYFSGDNIPAGTAAPTAAFNASDASHIPSLPQLSWTDPLDSSNSCSACSIIVLSTGLNSFDKDNLGTVSDLWNVSGSSRLSVSSLDTITDTVGTLENITGGSYLIGDNGISSDDSCNAKTINNLSDARGICPEIPGLEGGFDIAGLAYHANTADLRNDFDGYQSVSTYSVALAQNLPSYELDVNGKDVTFVPICQANTTGSRKLDQNGWTNCSFVDARIEYQDSYGGRMYVTWEDSLWGNDFDMDAAARIEWCIGTDKNRCPDEPLNANYTAGSGQGNFTYSDFDWKTGGGITADSVQFRVSTPLAAAGNAIRLGISISGVENEGSTSVKTNTPSAALDTNPKTTGSGASTKYIARAYQGNGEQFFLLREGGYTISRLVANSGNRMVFHEPLVYTADAGVVTGKLLENPLFFTAKYGSFNDIDGDGTPLYGGSALDTREWDVLNVDGQEIADGIPDNFFPITNPTQLGSSLSRVFEIIAARLSSGTAAAVVANSSTGLGSVYQAYYHPQYTDSDDNSITWGGVVHSLFVDDSGRFREDNGTKGKLDDTSVDYVVDIAFDTNATPPRTRFQRYSQTGSGAAATLTAIPGKYDLEEFASIWNARDVLATISQPNMLLQRSINGADNTWSENAGTRRYVFTYLDSISSGTPGAVDAGEVVGFVHSNFDPGNGNNNFRYLGLSNAGDAINLVKYIRGQDQAGWRSRLVDIPGDGTSTQKYWVLGDIVHSSPLVVNPPNQRFDLSNGDETYQAFKQQYQRRRQMIYSGANDGMLHAFNGGIWDPGNKQFRTQGYNTSTELYDVGVAHTLGAEMWAYVPQNLLPHLQWLKEKNYPHVYYMDGPPEAYDVNMFTPDATHPGGWGTILVAGMRLGGGEFPLDLDGDLSDETVMTSAYVILDITDPEQPPTLIAELTSSDLGYTTGEPALVKARVPSAAGSYTTPDINNWLLVFGSGPDTLATAVSGSQDAKLFAYDLVNRQMVTIDSAAQTPVANPSAYFGNFLSVDWDNDFVDDVVYAGTVEGTEVAPTGRLKRVVLDASATDMGLSTGTATMSDMFNANQPVSAAPNTQVSVSKNERWVLFGTGRLFTSVDNRSVTRQSFYGIKEPADYDTTGLTLGQLVDSTDILVEMDDEEIHDGAIGTTVTRFSTDLDYYDDLYSFMDSRPGWVNHLEYNAGTTPSERVFNTSLLVASTVIFTTYLPSLDLCTIEGSSFLYGLNFRTGTAETFGSFGEDPRYSSVAAERVALGQGAASAPVSITSTGDEVGVDGDASGDITVVAGLTTGAAPLTDANMIPVQSSRLSWEQLDIPF